MVNSQGGARYFINFIDDFTRKTWVYFLKQKSDAFITFKIWKAQVENQVGKKVKYLRTDNETEYTDKQLIEFCKSEGITRHFATPGTP